MAFANFLNEDDINKQNEQGQPSASPAQPGTTASNVINPNQAQGASAQQGKGSGFTNLQQYLGANAGQGVQTTQRVLDPQQEAIKGAVSSLNNDVNQAKSNVASNVVQKNQGLEDQIKSDPTKVNAADYNAYKMKTYSGPTSYAPSQDVYKQYDGLKTNVKMEDMADPKALAKTFKDNRYSYGMGALDNYLMTSEGQGAVDNYNKTNANVLKDKEAAIKGVNDEITTARATSAANTGSISQAVKDAQAAALGGVNAHQAEVDKKNYNLKKQQDVLSYLMDKVGQSTGKSIDPASYFAQSNKYGLGDAITPAERAKLEALNNLESGIDMNQYKAGSPGLQVSDAAIKAGLGYSYDPETGGLSSRYSDGTKGGMTLTNDPYYKKLVADALKAKGYS